MTGYGRGQSVSDGRTVTAEIKTVNSRYLDFTAKLPRRCAFAEDRLKTLVSERVSRGKVELYVGLDTVGAGNTSVSLDRGLLAGYIDAMREAAEEFGLKWEPSVSELTRFDGVFALKRENEDEDALWLDIRAAAEEALSRLLDMRSREGVALCDDIRQRLGAVSACVERLEARSPYAEEQYRQRLERRIAELTEGAQHDPARALTEVAIFAEKTSIAEELTRLKCHIGHFLDALCGKGHVGRKLDFLLQEINREVNTVGSKANDVDMAEIVVDVKAELEKIREQVQNLE